MALPCPHCGRENPEWSQFCSECGRTLVAFPPQPGMSPPGIARGVPRTRLGLFLLTGAFLTAWVPNLITAGLSLILLATGGILVILGRRPFGPRHARLVWIAVVVFVAAILLALLASLVLVAGMGGLSGSVDMSTLRGAARDYLWWNAATGVVFAAASVLLVLDLPPPPGKVLLLLAAGLTTVGAVVTAVEGAALIDQYFTGVHLFMERLQILEDFTLAIPWVYSVPGSLAFAAGYAYPAVLIQRGRLPRGAPAHSPSSPPPT